MATLKDVMSYVYLEYPRKDELSKSRFTKIIYLCDWKSALSRGQQITDIRWLYNNYGPYVDDVIELANSDDDFAVSMERNNYGAPKELIWFVGSSEPSLEEDEKEIIKFVIDRTRDLFWDDFIMLVYSTYPVLTRPKYDYLDLVSSAYEYKSDVLPKLNAVAA